jgi:hypothetical protein
VLDALTIKQLMPIVALVCWLYSGQGSRWPGVLLTVDLALYAVVEIWAKSLALLHANNLWLYNAYGPMEFMLKGTMAVACMRSLNLRSVALVFMVGYLAVHLYDRITFGGTGEFLMRSALTSAALLALFYTALLFSLAEDETQVVYRRPEFILFLGFILYNGGMVPLVGLLSLLNERDVALASRLFTINDVLYYTSHLAIIFASWRFRVSGHSLWRTKT